MFKRLVKWGAPGLVTVLGGTALALLMTGANVAADIGTRANSALRSNGDSWAELSIDARDIVLRGTTVDQSYLDAAMIRLANVHGVRSITSAVHFAPLANPYNFTATPQNGQIALAGAVPDRATRNILLAEAGIVDDGLQVRSGMPKRADWLTGVEFAIDQARHLDHGQVTTRDLNLSLVGRARSTRDYAALLLAVQNDVPPTIALAKIAITPPVVSPYIWKAVSDGKGIEITGSVPDTALTERLHQVDTAGLPVATGLALASGEPQGFADKTKLLLENLARLEQGTATIIDARMSLTGAAATPQIAQAVTQDLAQSGSIITLAPPRIDEYWMSATRQKGGVIVFDGYAPDAATRDRLSEVKGADTNFLKLGRGAPTYYQSAVDFGLSLLEHLSEGRIALHTNVVTLSGIVRSSADYDMLTKMIAIGAPQGLVLKTDAIEAQPASPYLWTATKPATGSIVLTGIVPNPEAKAALAMAEAKPDVAALTYGSGAPKAFMESTETALDLLKWLVSGSVTYDGAGWTIIGKAATPIDKAAIAADFATRKLAAANWALDVSPVAPSTPAIVTPYTWSAAKAANGTITLAGHVPTEGMKKFLAIRAGEKTVNRMKIGAGTPDGFINQARAALDAVMALQSAKARFDGAHWTLTGQAASAAMRDGVVANLGDLTKTWTIDIAIPEPIAPPTTEPEPTPTEPVAPPAVSAEPATTAPSVVETPDVPAIDPAYQFSANRAAGGSVTMRGMVPADPARRFFGVITKAPTTSITIAAGAPEDFILSAKAGLDGLMQLQSGDLGFANGAWRLTGKAPSTIVRDAVQSAIAALPAGKAWHLDITTPPPLEICQAKVAAFSAANSILFQSGAAIISDASEPALDQLATYLMLCPKADVDIEGHTDSDGDDQLNLGLSVARAEAVVKALIARDVAASRLYAIGYGESRPIADNGTSAGKRLNRRIVVKVLAHHID